MTKRAKMAALGHLGGLKGGPARRDALSPAERLKIAQIAAKASWGPAARKRRAKNGRKPYMRRRSIESA